MTDSTAPALFSAQHQTALELDLSLWRLTLSRNAAGHGRTRYHRHMTMALQCWDRFGIDQLPADWTYFVETSWKEWKERRDDHQLSVKKKRKRDTTFWEIRSTKESASSAGRNESLAKDSERLQDSLAALIERTTTGWSEVESRFSYAVQSIVPEISRGFFLPFLTVALGAMARIRTLFCRWRIDLVSNRLPTMLLQPALAGGDPSLDALHNFCRIIREDHEKQFQKSTRQDRQSTKLNACLARLGLSNQTHLTSLLSRGECSEPVESPNVASETTEPKSNFHNVENGNAKEDIGESMTAKEEVGAKESEGDHNRQVVTSLQHKNKSKAQRKVGKAKKKKSKTKKAKKEPDFFDNLFDRR